MTMSRASGRLKAASYWLLFEARPPRFLARFLAQTAATYSSPPGGARVSGHSCPPMFVHRIGVAIFLIGSEVNGSPRMVRSRLFLETSSLNWKPDYVHI